MTENILQELKLSKLELNGIAKNIGIEAAKNITPSSSGAKIKYKANMATKYKTNSRGIRPEITRKKQITSAT